MRLTEEQKAIVGHTGDAVVKAVAGSGKTSTIVEYARRRNSQRGLYFAYNRSVKLEAQKKFRKAGCTGVVVETAHSLAYRMLEVKNKFELMESGQLKTYDVVKLCKFDCVHSDLEHLSLARHVLNYLNLYCNSGERNIFHLDYLGTIQEPVSRGFVKKHFSDIPRYAKFLFDSMMNHEIPVTHDAYLKAFQLTSPLLDYDYICFDEGQDASPVMLDMFMNQRADKLIVGDDHQQVYSFRGAVNALSAVDFPCYSLSVSFRFPEAIANLGRTAISLKKYLGHSVQSFKLTGRGRSEGDLKSYGVVARSNLALLGRAIEMMVKGQANKIHFEGDLKTYTYMGEGASLFDVLLLFLKRQDKIRNEFIGAFSDFKEFQQYIEDAEDKEFGLVAKIVSNYGANLFDYMKALKGLHHKKHEADVIFSTVHKSKGMEYDHVELTDDFIYGDDLLKTIEKVNSDTSLNRVQKKIIFDGLCEEINMLYVAITRARYKIDLPFRIVPGDT